MYQLFLLVGNLFVISSFISGWTLDPGKVSWGMSLQHITQCPTLDGYRPQIKEVIIMLNDHSGGKLDQSVRERPIVCLNLAIIDRLSLPSNGSPLKACGDDNRFNFCRVL